jgi:hypothetical protein
MCAGRGNSPRITDYKYIVVLKIGHKMSIEIASKVLSATFGDYCIESLDRTVSASTIKFVALCLADHANGEGRSCYPSFKRLCMETELTERTVLRAVRALQEMGIIKIVGSSRLGTNDYEFNLAKLSEMSSRIMPKASDPGTPPSDPGTPPSDPGTPPLRPTVGRTVIKPSVNHQSNHQEQENALAPVVSSTFDGTTTVVKKDVLLSEEDLKQVNAKVDAIIAQDKAASLHWKFRETVDEAIAEYLDVYIELTGQRPNKREIYDWMKAVQEWLDMGATKDDLRNAYKIARPGTPKGGFMVTRPGSLTTTIRMVAGERRTRKPEATDDDIIKDIVNGR